jgi:hypothetical protein
MPLGTYFYFLCFDQKGDPSQVRFFVRDFSQYYTRFEQSVPPLPRDLDCLAVSRYQKSGTSSKDSFNGPVSLYQECYRDVTPERLTKKAYSDLSNEEKITYRVVRSVCRAECLGFLDSINAHDSAYISLGLYHWAFAHLSLKAFNEGCTAGAHPAAGELEAFLAYLKYKYADTYDAAFGAFGVEPSKPWTSLTLTGIRTYEDSLSQWIYHEDSTGAPAPKMEPVDPTCARNNYLRSWHMFYRFQMATRVFPEVWQAAWDMARFRLRDILSAEIPKEWGFSNGAQNPLHIGDLITSELNVAFLLQWHIVAPATLIGNHKARVPLQRALEGLSPDPTKWTSLDEAKIYKRFIGAAKWKPDPPKAKLKTPTKLLRERMKNQIIRYSLKSLDYPDGVLAGYPPNTPGTNTRLPIAALSPLRDSFRLAMP